MNQEEFDFIEEQKRQVANLQFQNQQLNTAQFQQDLALEKQETNIIKEQLDLNPLLDYMNHLLRGDYLELGENGEVWKTPIDTDLIILSEKGVHLIMNALRFYLNTNTLLSNYETEIIDQKMEDFALTLADDIFMEYESVFRFPSFEECKTKLLARISSKVELRKFALELLGKEVNEVEIKEEIIKEMEGSLNKEIEKIKEQTMKNKLKRFELIMRVVQDAVHSTYLRAWNGAERRTLRQHIHINETRGTPEMPKHPASFNPLGWFKR